MSQFITFEGGEGAGKSTQIQYLYAYLLKNNQKVVCTREPGGSPGAELIRDLLVRGAEDRWSSLTETFLMFAARSEHVQYTIRPALENQNWIICDRFMDSSYAYQGYGRGVNLEYLDSLCEMTLDHLKPNKTFILDIDPLVGLERVRQRIKTLEGAYKEGERFESLDLEFHKRVRQGFLEIARRNPNRCIVLDAFQSPEKIFQDICTHLNI